ncbi:MAG: hypothetical protein ACTSR2_04905 [Candidatus Hodarchaeales archaeon]
MKIKTVQLLVKEISSTAYELENLITKMLREVDPLKWDEMKMEGTKLIFIIKGLAEQLQV